MREDVTLKAEELASTTQSRDVRLTLVGLHEEDDSIQIDFELVFKMAKRVLALWLCLAIGFGALAGAVGVAVEQVTGKEPARALLSFSRDASSTNYNIQKVKSPGVVENALNELGLDLLNVERIRNAITVSGIIPDGAHEIMSMYYTMIQEGGRTREVIQSLLDTPYDVTRYVVSFDYAAVDMNREDGLLFMNTLLRAYQDYFNTNYNYNSAMGSALTAVDYRDYDYAEAVDIFSTALSNVTSYLSAVESSATSSFRSVETGFSFADLRRTVSTLRGIDLDRLSSYIIIHSVSSLDAEAKVSYYQWRIDNLTRQRAVERTRLASLTRSIAEYEKDPILVAVQDGNSVVANMEDLNSSYDALIREELDSQAAIASYSRSISFYESVIESFRSAAASSPEDIAKVEGYLESLNEKLNALIEQTAKTVDEYYDNVAFSNRIQVLVPASAKKPPLFSKITLLIVAAVEVMIAGVFFLIACAAGIHRGKPKTQPQDA